MKRVLIICAAVCLLVLSFASCVREKPNDVENTFFSDEYLSQAHCENIPIPSLENAVLRNEYKLYFNLSADEYRDYVSAVIEYLNARDDVFNLSQVRTLNCLLILPYQYVCEPLKDGFVPDDDVSIVFSLDGEIEEQEGTFSEPVVIHIAREGGSLSSGFEYNCIMSIDGAPILSYVIDHCYSEHTYLETELCVPYRDGAQTVTQYTCKYCGYSYLGEECGDGESYGVTIAEGREYLKGTVPQKIKAGEVYKLYTSKYMDADIVLRVNGTKLTSTEAGGGELWCYTFVMPCESVEISVELVDGFLVNQELATYCTWLAQLDPSSVVQIKTVDAFIGVAPDRPKTEKITEDSKIIAEFINELREISVSEISPEDADIDGGSGITIEFYLADGSSEILIINNGIYSGNVNGTNFYIRLNTNVPSLP